MYFLNQSQSTLRQDLAAGNFSASPSRSTDQDISSLLPTNYTVASTLRPRAHIQCVSFTLALLSVMYGWMKALYVIICSDRRDDKPDIPYY